MKRIGINLSGAPLRMLTALVLAAAASAAASAQQILVVDQERALNESAVGQHIAAQLERIGTEMTSELQPIQAAVRSENEALTTETSAMTEEAIRQRPDLIERFGQLQQDMRNLEAQGRMRQQELAATEQAALQPVVPILQEIMQEVMSERSGVILLDQSVTVMTSGSVDITDVVIERLNARITTTPVNRVRAPQRNANNNNQ
ncbi:OmpH family outer membrane protein [Alkalicaulis satelles]|uniref:OmpH family outer membrane protein n=1 Tax=Alkalicaulis satelles TaxID=2609175 RepID=A0A5M6ZBR4_9PROT|nr:OmpH family outer membrane protein [Alkalicaulis satelles]KAA5801590.1 OmpH family outer membrane protein [Alkalicaulis satelles]